MGRAAARVLRDSKCKAPPPSARGEDVTAVGASSSPWCATAATRPPPLTLRGEAAAGVAAVHTLHP